MKICNTFIDAPGFFPTIAGAVIVVLGGTADTNFRQSLSGSVLTRVSGSVLTRVAGDNPLLVVVYLLVTGMLRTIKSIRERLSGA